MPNKLKAIEIFWFPWPIKPHDWVSEMASSQLVVVSDEQRNHRKHMEASMVYHGISILTCNNYNFIKTLKTRRNLEHLRGANCTEQWTSAKWERPETFWLSSTAKTATPRTYRHKQLVMHSASKEDSGNIACADFFHAQPILIREVWSAGCITLSWVVIFVDSLHQAPVPRLPGLRRQ